jgi:predicted ABC-type ATPase
MAVARVAERVRMGGHNGSEATIRQRYQRSIQDFFRLYRPVVSSWRLYDNTQAGAPRLLARTNEGGVETILDDPVWQQIQREPTA